LTIWISDMVKPTLQLEYHAPNSRVKVRVRDVTPTELDRLYHEGMISRDLHDAGEAAMRDLWKARMLGISAVDYNASGGGGDPQPMSSGKSNALKRVNEWLGYVRSVMGSDGSMLLMRVLCDNVMVTSPSTILALRQALKATVNHQEERRRDKPAASLFGQAFDSTHRS
jgi:hypothetical protein